MRKFLLAMFVVIFSTNPLLTLAQTDIQEDSEEPISELNSEEQAEFIPIIPEQQAIPNTTSCFDDYRFGSVQTDISPSVLSTVPGVPITFSGKIINDNPYPIVDGSVYVKIFKKQKTASNTDLNTKQNGHEIVDQFFAKEKVSIKAKGSEPILFAWQIPRNAPTGDYQAVTYFASAKRFNLSGLSFTDDVTGNKVDFSIKSDVISPPAYFNKNTVTLNQKPHKFAIFPLHFSKDENVTAEAELINPSKTDKTITLTWKLYKWDGLREENKKDEKTETITIKASETKKLSYTVNKDTGSVAYLIAEAKDKESKSILNIRFVREGIEEIRLNFPSIISYPLTQGQENSLFSCVHSTNSHIVKDNTLTLTLKTLDGKTIHQYTYQGDISGRMMGVKEAFTPKETVQDFMLTATLKNQGNTIEEVTQTYLCDKLGENCKKASTSIISDSFDFGENGMWLKLVLFLVGAVLLFLIIRRMVMKRSTMSFLLGFILVSSILFGLGGVERAEAEWRDNPVHQQVNGNLYYVWAYQTETGNKPAVHGADAFGNPYYGVLGLIDPDITVHYRAEATDGAGQALTDKANVPVGSQIKFQFKPYENDDIEWVGAGYVADSPKGRWIANAQPPTPTSEQGRFYWGGGWRPRNICHEYDLVDTEDNTWGLIGGSFRVRYYPPSPPASVSGSLFCNGQVISGRFVCTATIPGRPGGDNVAVYIPLNYQPSEKAFTSSEVISCTKSATAYLTCTYPPGDPWKIPIHIPLSVNPPTKQPISVSSNLNCGTGIPDASGYVTCSVTGEGPITADLTYNQTYARFYHRQYDIRNRAGLVPGCYGANVPMNPDMGAFKQEGSDFIVTIPSSTINFKFIGVDVPANSAPTPPIVTGPSGVPDGTDTGVPGVNNTFTAVSTDSDVNDKLYYGFDWNWTDDGNDTNDAADIWVPDLSQAGVSSGIPQSSNYSWSAGTYRFRVQAKDDKGGVSGWKIHTIMIKENGACGSAEGTPSATKPSANLCLPGTTTTSVVTGGSGSNWTWMCLGPDSAIPTDDDSCSAPFLDLNNCEESQSDDPCDCDTEEKTRHFSRTPPNGNLSCITPPSISVVCTATEKNACRDFNYREVAP